MAVYKTSWLILLTLVVAAGATFAGALRTFTVAGKGSLTSRTIKNGRTLRRDFAFNAYIGADGNVNGTATLVNPEFDGADLNEPYHLELEITCMNVVGNVAFFGGMTRQTNDPDLVDAAYFSVQSDQQGDSISQVYFFDDDPNTMGDPQLCMRNQVGDFPMETIESGEIHLRK